LNTNAATLDADLWLAPNVFPDPIQLDWMVNQMAS
jgi:hypothetical protein